MGRAQWFDCPGTAPTPEELPEGEVEMLASQEPSRWDALPLYTEVCVGTVPAMIHHNSVDKSHREKQWDKTWWHGRSRALLERRKKQGAPQLAKGIPVENKGKNLLWDELCPPDVEAELFGD